jgi:hypothetical protein
MTRLICVLLTLLFSLSGPAMGEYSDFGQSSNAARGGGWKPTPFNPCFAPGTHVLMADGSTKPIEEVEEGDEVLAEDPGEEGEPTAHRVTQVHKNWTLRFIHVAVDEDGDGSSDGEIKGKRGQCAYSCKMRLTAEDLLVEIGAWPGAFELSMPGRVIM